LNGFLERTQADELMITAHLFDQAARLRSVEIVAAQRERLRAAAMPERVP
jgi:hypothetical protein